MVFKPSKHTVLKLQGTNSLKFVARYYNADNDNVDVLPSQIHTEASFLDLNLKIKYFRFLFLIWLAKYSTRKIVLDDTVNCVCTLCLLNNAISLFSERVELTQLLRLWFPLNQFRFTGQISRQLSPISDCISRVSWTSLSTTRLYHPRTPQRSMCAGFYSR